jgi:hypothetical protein
VRLDNIDCLQNREIVTLNIFLEHRLMIQMLLHRRDIDRVNEKPFAIVLCCLIYLGCGEREWQTITNKNCFGKSWNLHERFLHG